MRLFIICLLFFVLAVSACQRTGKFQRPLGDGIPVLLFAGTGTSDNDVWAIVSLLDQEEIHYSLITSSELNQITIRSLLKYRLLIVPGGNFEIMGKSLAKATADTIRMAVQHGLGYLGICAGAFLAGKCIYNGFDLSNGVQFGFYADERRGIRKAAVPIHYPDGTVMEQYWEDGPQLSGWGTVAAKFPDGTPAVVEGLGGEHGWVVLTGIHAEAPDAWRNGMHFNTNAAKDNAYAVTLIRAALDRKSLEHY